MKGSKIAVLNLIDSDSFLKSINKLIEETGAKMTSEDVWKPKGMKNKSEQALSTFLRENFDSKLGNDILKWWLKHGTSTPNWDLISTFTINNKKGILLVEAKAHVGELDKSGKKLKNNASDNSKMNHIYIYEAIEQANITISKQMDGVCISRDKCYQLSNRIAHAWWLASQGIPVVLLYLGFLNCKDMDDGKRKLIKTDEDWQSVFTKHAKLVGIDSIMGKWIDCGESNFITISKSY